MSIPFSSADRGSRPCEAPVPLDDEMAELSLLLPAWQAMALDRAARADGVSAGQMLRRLIQDYLNHRQWLGS
jgi:hypothetical protein